MAKSPDAFRTISEVACDLDVPQHVLRFWETKFSQIKPLKRAGGRRYYRPEDVDLLRGIRILLYTDGFTIKGVQKVFRDQGVKVVAEAGRQRGTNGAARPALQATLAQAPSLPLEQPAKGKGNGGAASLEDVLALLTETKTLLGRRRALAASAPARPAAASRSSA